MSDPTAYPQQQATPVCPRHPDRVAYVRCQRCGRPVCPECQRPAAVGVQCVDCVRQQAETVRASRRPCSAGASATRPRGDLRDHRDLRRGLRAQQSVPGPDRRHRVRPLPGRERAVAVPHLGVRARRDDHHILFNMLALWMVGAVPRAAARRAALRRALPRQRARRLGLLPAARLAAGRSPPVRAAPGATGSPARWARRARCSGSSGRCSCSTATSACPTPGSGRPSGSTP